jgi:hypothetical protein
MLNGFKALISGFLSFNRPERAACAAFILGSLVYLPPTEDKTFLNS